MVGLARDRDRMAKFVNGLKKRGYTSRLMPLHAVETMFEEADARLFSSVINNITHVLRKHLTTATVSK